MIAPLTSGPGQRGAKKLPAELGDALVSVSVAGTAKQDGSASMHLLEHHEPGRIAGTTWEDYIQVDEVDKT